MRNHAVDAHQYPLSHLSTQRPAERLVGGNFTVDMLDNHLVNVGSASVRQYWG